jgi:hypothetical protein
VEAMPNSKQLPKKVTVSRKLAPNVKAQVTRHSRHVGEIVGAWNLLHDHLYNILVALLWDLGPSRFRTASAIWNSFQSDKGQRDMLLAVAVSILETTDSNGKKMIRQSNEIKWLVQRTHDLSARRNDAAHIAINFVFVGPNFAHARPANSTKESRFKRFEEAPTSTVWRRVRGDLIALASFAFRLVPHIYRYDKKEFLDIQQRTPWPRRPRLLSIVGDNRNLRKPRRKKLR